MIVSLVLSTVITHLTLTW